MKRVLVVLLVLVLAALGALASTFRAATLPVAELADMQIPRLNPPPEMKLS